MQKIAFFIPSLFFDNYWKPILLTNDVNGFLASEVPLQVQVDNRLQSNGLGVKRYLEKSHLKPQKQVNMLQLSQRSKLVEMINETVFVSCHGQPGPCLRVREIWKKKVQILAILSWNQFYIKKKGQVITLQANCTSLWNLIGEQAIRCR